MRVLALVLPLVLALTVLSSRLLAGDEDDPTGAVYVALGDSYTAAPGIGDLDGDDGCFRSRNNYPHLLADSLDLEVEDASCSGASSASVTTDQHTPEGASLDPQIEALGEDTELVTVRIGANDSELFGRTTLDCVELARTERGNAPCAEADARAGASASARHLAGLDERLVVTLESVRDRAPDARIIAIGYPQVFPTPQQGGCPELPLAPGDLAWAHRVNAGFDDALREAARETGVDFVDVFARTADHHICAEDPWIAGAAVAEGRRGEAFHPYAQEAALVASLLERELAR